jgi:hypothetical protein
VTSWRSVVAPLLLATLFACEGSPRSAARPKTAAQRMDSARAVRLAMRALGDTVPQRVDAITAGAEGWLVRLLPQRGGTAGGGEVWVERDSSATIVKRY